MFGKKAIPFQVTRGDARTFIAQVRDGLREAIVGGYYVPGDKIPSSRRLSRALGVSEIVARAALRRLADDGLLETRPRIGSVVRDLGSKQWRGHVVFVYHANNIGYFQNVFAEELRNRLNAEGFLFTRAAVSGPDYPGNYDYSLIDASLSRSVNLVLSLTSRRRIFSHIARSGVPFAAIIGDRQMPADAIGVTRIDYTRDISSLVVSCRRAGIGKVMVYHWMPQESDYSAALRKEGLEVCDVRLKPTKPGVTFGSIEHAGFDGFTKLAQQGRLDREALHFLTDDYLARGALMALSFAGLRAPEDIRFATFANAGFDIAYGHELSRMELNPVASGAAVAAAALAFLKTGKYPEGSLIWPKWIPGQTLGKEGTP